MMECSWGFNQYGYSKITGGSAFCSHVAVAQCVCPVDTIKRFVYSSATTILKANYCSSQQLINKTN